MFKFTFFAIFLTILSCDKSLNSNMKIVGGAASTDRKFYAGLLWAETDNTQGKANIFCGASFVAKRYLVTAAHCLHKSTQKYKVQVGYTNDHGVNIHANLKVEAIVLHPRFDEDTLVHDIAVMKVEDYDEQRFPVKIIPIAMNDQLQLGQLATETATVIGAGSITNVGTILQPKLREVAVNIVPRSVCQEQYFLANIDQNVLCAAAPVDGYDACNGDSGGPLVMQDAQGQTKLVGLVSWESGCANAQYPMVYTRVSAYMTWVQQQMTKLETPYDFSVRADLLAFHHQSYCYGNDFIELKKNSLGTASSTITYQYRLAGSFIKDFLPASPEDRMPMVSPCLYVNSQTMIQSEVVQDPIFGHKFLQKINQIDWSAPADQVVAKIRLQCQEHDVDLRFSLKNKAIFIGDDLFVGMRRVTVSDLEQNSQKIICQTADVGVAFYAKTNQDGTVSYYMKPNGLAFGSDHNATYILNKGIFGRNQNFAVQVINNNEVHIENRSDKTIFTWQLACEKEFYLDHIMSDQQQGKHQILFEFPMSSAAKFEKGEIKRFNSNLTTEELKQCQLNGESLQLSGI